MNIGWEMGYTFIWIARWRSGGRRGRPKNFGEEVHEPAVLECAIETAGFTLDLRKLDDYRWFVEEYAQVIAYLTEKMRVERNSFKGSVAHFVIICINNIIWI